MFRVPDTVRCHRSIQNGAFRRPFSYPCRRIEARIDAGGNRRVFCCSQRRNSDHVAGARTPHSIRRSDSIVCSSRFSAQVLFAIRRAHWARSVYLLTEVETGPDGRPGPADSIKGVNLTRVVRRPARKSPLARSHASRTALSSS